MQPFQIINIPEYTNLIEHTGLVFLKKKFFTLSRSKKNVFFLFNMKNRSLLKITFPIVINQIIFAKGKIILYRKKQKLFLKASYLLLGS